MIPCHFLKNRTKRINLIMESQRSLLFIALLVVSFLIYQQWQIDHAPVPVKPAQTMNTENTSSNISAGDFVPQSADTDVPATATLAQNKIIHIKTDVLDISVSTLGGDIIKAALLNYETELGSNETYTLLNRDTLSYVAQSGIIGAQGPDANVKGRPVYQVSNDSFSLADGESNVVVDLLYVDSNNITFTKRFTLYRGEYKIDVEYIIDNNSANAASVQLYSQLKQTSSTTESGGMVMTYRGTAYSTDQTRYEKYDFDDIEENDLKVTTSNGWVAMLQHYFVTAWVPASPESNTIYTRYINNSDAVIGVKSPAIIVQPNTSESQKATLYVGPKNQDELEKIADGLDLTVDYGILFFISQPLFWLLVKIQSFVHNWGVAIILITVVVKGIMYPLTKAQYTSMAKMRKLQPKMTALKERFGDDKQKMTQGMMELYKKEKVNPAGGCLPILLQMPIFLALYWVFVESVELRHAPFALWINDLSAMDPYFVLPLLMGISMFIMQKMQPMTIQDPMQQKIMQYMPVMFTVFMAWFPSGLVLYWFISNVISIIQMKIIFAGIEKAEAKA